MRLPAYRRTMLALYVANAVTIVAGAAGWAHLRREFWKADAARELAFVARDDTARLLDALLDAETGQRGFLLTGREPYLADYDRGRLAARGEADALGPDVRQAVAEKLDELLDTVTRVRRGDKPGAYTVVNNDRGKQLMDKVRAAVGARVADLDAVAAAARRVQLGRADDVLVLLPATWVTSFGFTTGMLFAARRR